jgi:hypothetical protein
MRNTAERVVTDLVAAGLVERHRAVEAERVVHRSLESEDLQHADRTPAGRPAERQGARTMLVEIAGYVGSALVLASVGLFLAQYWDEFSASAQVAVLALLAVVLGGAGAAVSRIGGGYAEMAAGRDEIRRRLTSTLLVVGALAAAVAVGRQAASVVDDAASNAPAFFGGVTMLALAAAGYRYAHSALGLLAIGAATFQVVVTGVEGDSTIPAGLTLVAVAVVWMAAVELTPLVRERSVGRAVGSAFALFGAQMTMFEDGSEPLAYALTAAVAVAAFVLYLRTAGWPYLAAGVLGVTLVVPEAVMHWTEGSLGVAGGVLVAGLTLLGASLAGLRMRQEVAEQGEPAGHG